MNRNKIAAALTIAMGMTMLPAVNVQAAVYNGWEKNGSYWYYYSNGSLKTGWVNDGGTWYYLNSDGSMKTGWLNNGGTWYYLNSNGAMKTGWLNDGGTWYYLNSDGSMKTGWLIDQDRNYYLNDNGSMQTGWFKDSSGDWHYSYASGAVAEYYEQLFSIYTNEYIYKTNADKITVNIMNKTDHDYETEINEGCLEFYNEEIERWVDVPLKDSAKKITKFNIPAHSTRTYSISVDDLASGKLEPGFYRVHNDLGKSFEYTEFKVKEASDVEVDIPDRIIYAAGQMNSWVGYTITNNTDKKLTVGSEYAVQKYIDGEWKDVPLKSKEFSDESYTIQPHSTTETITIRLDNFYEKYHEGKYRIIKTINGKQVYDEVYLSEIEF